MGFSRFITCRNGNGHNYLSTSGLQKADARTLPIEGNFAGNPFYQYRYKLEFPTAGFLWNFRKSGPYFHIYASGFNHCHHAACCDKIGIVEKWRCSMEYDLPAIHSPLDNIDFFLYGTV